MKFHPITDKHLASLGQPRLVGQWNPTEEDDDNRDPDLVGWSDGSPATIAEFRSLQLSTSCTTFDESGIMQEHLFPGCEGIASYEERILDWVIRVDGLVVVELNLPDRCASDIEIQAMSSVQLVSYAIRILRT